MPTPGRAVIPCAYRANPTRSRYPALLLLCSEPGGPGAPSTSAPPHPSVSKADFNRTCSCSRPEHDFNRTCSCSRLLWSQLHWGSPARWAGPGVRRVTSVRGLSSSGPPQTLRDGQKSQANAILSNTTKKSLKEAYDEQNTNILK